MSRRSRQAPRKGGATRGAGANVREGVFSVQGYNHPLVGNLLIGSADVTFDQWHHVAFVYDGAEERSIWTEPCSIRGRRAATSARARADDHDDARRHCHPAPRKEVAGEAEEVRRAAAAGDAWNSAEPVGSRRRRSCSRRTLPRRRPARRARPAARFWRRAAQTTSTSARAPGTARSRLSTVSNGASSASASAR